MPPRRRICRSRAAVKRNLNAGERRIKILRGRSCQIIPEGEATIRQGDRLMITGSQRELENFCEIMASAGLKIEEGSEMQTLKAFIEHQEDVPEERQILLYGVTMEKDMPQEGKPIRISGIKTDWSAFLVGIERDTLPIMDPHPDMLLKSGDLLWLLGAQEMAVKLSKQGLLD